MMFKPDKMSKVPLYAQAADWMEKRIEAGDPGEGERLPSEREMCALAGISRDTVKRAYLELERRGLITTGRGSGSRVTRQNLKSGRAVARETAGRAVERLKEAGLTRHETERAFLELMWSRLPESEKLNVAWVDCSGEIINDTVKELEKDCNIHVTPFLLEETEENPEPLFVGNYDLIATTINHLDDLQKAFLEKMGRMPDADMEKVVLTVSRMTVSRLAGIEEGADITAFFDSGWCRSNTERFLNELSVNGEKHFVHFDEAYDRLTRCGKKSVVILPQDFSYRDGLVGEIYRYCEQHGISCIVLKQIVDNGSMLHLRKRLQRKWMAGRSENGA